MKKLILILVVFCAGAYGAQAQSEGSIVRRDGLTNMHKGEMAMYDGAYEEADEFFRQALGQLSRLPSEMAYFFGRNSYHLNKYKQAINWLTKYIELKGTSGQYYEDASLFLDRANEAYRKIKEQQLIETENKLTTDGSYDCPGDFVLCPICHGSGVLIKSGKFGAVYQTCPYSGLSGQLTCEQYNQYLKGELGMELQDD